MGFWESYDKKMSRRGISTSLNQRRNTPAEIVESYDCQGSAAGDDEPAEGMDIHLFFAEKAVEEGDIDAAFKNYFESFTDGNIHALMPLADLCAVLAVHDKYDRPYYNGTDPNKDYFLELAVTFYMIGLIFPECESEAEEHLQQVQERCLDQRAFQRMVERVSDRISDKIAENPINFVRTLLSQYKHKR